MRKQLLLLISFLFFGFMINTTLASDFYKSPFLKQQIITNYGTFCANEGGKCNFKGEKKVLYVSEENPDKYIVKTFTDGVNCNSNTFTDPDKGNKKQCYFFDKNIDITNIVHKYIYNDNIYLLKDSNNNVIIKDFAGLTMAVIPDFPLDFSNPYVILNDRIVYINNNVSNDSDYIELSDNSGNTYNKFIYIVNHEFYTNKEKKVKIGVLKDVAYTAFSGSNNIYVYYTDGTAERFTIDYTNNTVVKNNTNYDEIGTDKLVELGVLGDNVLFYSIKNKNFVIGGTTGYETITGLNNVNFSNIESLNINTSLNHDTNKVVSRIEVVVDGIKYATKLNNLKEFERINNNYTFGVFYDIIYNVNTEEIEYNVDNLDNNYQGTFKLNINTVYPVRKCGNFNYITNTGKFINLVFDKCIYRLSNYTNGNIIDNTMTTFYKDYFEKLKYIENLNNNVNVVIENKPFRNVTYSGKKIGLKHYKETNYKYDQQPKGNINIEYLPNSGLKFSKKTDIDSYTTFWYKTPFMKILNGLKVSYDVQFNDGAKWGGITIGNIFIDVNPERIGFRGPEKYVAGLEQDKKYHVDIIYSLVKTEPLTYNAKIYIDGKLVNELDYENVNLEKDFMNQGIGIRSNYYKGNVEYTNINFSYVKYAKDKKIYDLLNIKDYFKFRTQLTNMDDANKYVTKLLTEYKLAYFLANGINIRLLETLNYVLKPIVDNVMGLNYDYKTRINDINQKISDTTTKIDNIKLSIFTELPIAFDNIIYSFSEKQILDFTTDLNNLQFVDKNIDNNNLNYFTDKQKALINKEITYKKNVINNTYRLERTNNMIDYILNTSNVIKFLETIDTNVDNPSLKINGQKINVSNLLNNITQDNNKIYTLSFNADGNIKNIFAYFNGDYDINKFLVPGVMDNFTKTKTIIDTDGNKQQIQVFDKMYFDLYGLTIGLGQWTNNTDYNSLFLSNKLYKFLAVYTNQDIINTIKNHTDMIINKYIYDNKDVTANGPVRMSDFIANFNDPNKSNLYKDDNGDGKNDYVLEDVLLDIYTKLTDNIPNNQQDINVDFGNDPQNALNLFTLLSFKRYLIDHNIQYTNTFTNGTDLNNYNTNNSNTNVIDYYDNYKNFYNYVVTNNDKLTYQELIDKNNVLINYINLFIKGNNVPLIDNSGNRVDGDINTLETLSYQNLIGYSLNKTSYYTKDNINWDFYENNYIPYYKNNGLTAKIDLIDSYETNVNELDTLNNGLQLAIKNFASSLNDRLNLFRNLIDISSISFDNTLDSVSDSNINDISNTIKTDIINRFKELINNDLESKLNTNLITQAIKTNIDNFGSIAYLIDHDKFIPSALDYTDSDVFSNEVTQYQVNTKIIKGINLDNITQYEKYDIPTSKRFNEYYGILKILLETKKQLLVGDNYYDDVIASINKIDDYKESKSKADLNNYVTYLKDNVKKLYKTNIIDLYNTVKPINYNNTDFNFVLKDYIKNISGINIKIDEPMLQIDLADSIWNDSNIEYNPAKNKDINNIYDSLIKMIEDKVNGIDPYINYNTVETKLNNIEKDINDFESKYNNELTFDGINNAYNTLKNNLNNIDLSNITIDTSKLKQKKTKLIDRLETLYTEKIKNTKENISKYLEKYFNTKAYSIYLAKDTNSLQDKYVDFLTDLGKIANKPNTTDIFNTIVLKIKEITEKTETDIKNNLKPNTCVVNDNEKWDGLKTGTEVCGNLINNDYINTVYNKALDIYKQQTQYMSSTAYAEYFTQLLSIDKDALDKIFDWDKIDLKTNPDTEVITQNDGISLSGAFRNANCSYIIYKKTVWLGLVCDSNIKKIDEPVDNNDPFNSIVLNFRDTLGKNIYYNLINHYNTLQQINDKYQSHYKSVFLVLKSKDTGKVFYLKSFYIPNGVTSISIKNTGNLYMHKTFNDPFLTQSGIKEITASVNNDLDLLSKNGKKLDDVQQDSLIFNDQILTAFLDNNVGYIIDKIKMIEPVVNEAVVSSLYNNLSDILTNTLGFDGLYTKKNILKANQEKVKLFNDLNMINNVTFNTYETTASTIQQDLSGITYFVDAKNYLLDLLQSKINSFKEMKDSLLFQKKINKIDSAIADFNNHISDNSLDGINKLKINVKNLIKSNFSNTNVVSSLMDKLENKYIEVKTAIENNIKYSTSYIDSDSEIEGKTEANNILTESFNNKFVEQLSFNKILEEEGIIKIKNNQYIVDKTKLSQIDHQVNDIVPDTSKIDIKDMLDNNVLETNIKAEDILSTRNKTDVKNKLIGFIYITLKNGKYNIPIDVVEVKNNDSGFFEGVSPSGTADRKLKSIQYNSILSEIKTSDGKVIGNKNIEGDLNIFLPKESVELELNSTNKYLTVVRNLSNQKVTAEFYEKTGDNIEPIYMNDFVISNVAKINKNFDNNIFGLKTEKLNITR